MTKKVLTTPVSDADIESLKIGDVFYLSGALITCPPHRITNVQKTAIRA